MIRDRIVELLRVPAGTLKPNPRNWRLHPPAQQEALRGVLKQIGYAAALLARRLPDGSLELIDGHLRAETTPDEEVPVLVVDLSDAEAALMLTVLDPLGAMAQPDAERFAALAAEVTVEDAAVQKLIDGVLNDGGRAGPVAPPASDAELLTPTFQIVVQCRDEDEQRDLYEEMTGRGYCCRVLSI